MSEDKKLDSQKSEDSIDVEHSFSDAMTEEPTETAQAEPEASPQSEEEKLRAKVAELEDRLLRTMADFDNFRKRSIKQMDDAARNAGDRVFSDVLDVLSNVDRAIAHCNESSDVASLKQGMEMIHGQFMGLLTKYDIKPIEAIGKTFDPNFHEALMQIDSDEHAEHVVAAEINKGFMQGDRVIRHSQVAVSKGSVSNNDKNKK